MIREERRMKREYRIGFKIALIVASLESIFWFIWHFFAPLPEITTITFEWPRLLWFPSFSFCKLPFVYQPWWMDAVFIVLMSWPVVIFWVKFNKIANKDISLIGFIEMFLPMAVIGLAMTALLIGMRPTSFAFILATIPIGGLVGILIWFIIKTIFTMPMRQVIGRWIVKWGNRPRRDRRGFFITQNEISRTDTRNDKRKGSLRSPFGFAQGRSGWRKWSYSSIRSGMIIYK